jgi:heme a synthase|tara:strand:+ start:3431 stop:4456 length:1026 start_codon:yes stop_codon:yes gene_type:complete
MFIIKNKIFQKPFLYWLCSLIFLVSSIIVVGGLTRLTGSGLSITEWNVFKGTLPPLSNDDWNSLFLLYKEIPQYYLLNKGISLDEFKIIFYWEYFHRLLGRIIGLTFIIPFLYFLYKKVFYLEYNLKFFIIFILILFQGFIGWYMVKSGLTNNVTVSHYRLSIHLFIAFIILSSLFWHLLNFINKTNRSFFSFSNSFILLKILLALLFLQIIFGAFVSGLDAGNIYQSWPLMNGNYFPDDIEITFFNLFHFDNQSSVQFIHRNLAYVIFFVYIIVGIKIYLVKEKILYKSYLILSFLIFTQIFLGIATLISGLEIKYASLHQFTSIFLIFASLNIYHRSLR